MKVLTRDSVLYFILFVFRVKPSYFVDSRDSLVVSLGFTWRIRSSGSKISSVENQLYLSLMHYSFLSDYIK